MSDFITKSQQLLEGYLEEGCGKKKCKCKGKGKKKCKCKQPFPIGYEADGDGGDGGGGMGESLEEGRTKRALEDKVEKKCNCDGGCSLNYKDHAEDCPAQETIKDNV